MSDTLVINEIYLSIQGESTLAGLPCVFVRLTACNLRCSYCDTAYAFAEGRTVSLGEVRDQVYRLAAPFQLRTPRSALRTGPESPHVGYCRLPLVELTGGFAPDQRADGNSGLKSSSASIFGDRKRLMLPASLSG